MREIFWTIFCVVLTIGTFATSIRLSLLGYINFPRKGIIGWLTNTNWCYSLFLYLPAFVGEFARVETSPLPWRAFIQESSRHGTWNGLLMAVIVTLIDLWLFWIPAHLWIQEQENIDRTKARMARLINLLGGLLLTTGSNPIYKVLDILRPTNI